MKKSHFIVLVLLLFLISATSVHAKQIKLNYRLKWLFNASVAGDIYADAKGYFADAGLTVKVKEGSPEKNAINELELGHADFGVASADQVIRAIDKGAKIVVIAQIFQVNPMQWIYRADQPEIKTLEDLKGRNIGITFGGNDETIMNTVFARAGITKKDVTITGVRFDFTPFFRQKVDVWPVYRNSQGVILKDKLDKEGETVYFFNPADFGVNFVANSVITSETMLKNRPEMVEKFLEALLKGWEAAMNPANEASVLQEIKKLDQGTNDEIRQQQLVATRTLIKPSVSIKIGTIDINAWKQTEHIMFKEKQIKNKVNIATRLIQNIRKPVEFKKFN
ncbi:ABC transporter substrate-binding protein [Desulfobacula phenolica]|uniref:Thiamine pyrimidine synthase n=1 Tax=Desulfobacula phenolica TaxID=90732 RepID=A0A1H2ISB1_9BACT|nr:ABC transporter substrate-binding protein [Desulfobacula phenolica]SDU47057.1 NitT/TauT family transport system substrate-binding protein [Desulfobacula phenolica]